LQKNGVCNLIKELQKEKKIMSQPENQFGDTPSQEHQPNDAPVYAAPIVPQQDVPMEPARMGAGARLIGTILSPGETFADVNRKPDWIVPLIILSALVVGSYYFVTWRLKPDIAKITREQMVKTIERFGGQKPTEEQINEAVNRQMKWSKVTPIFAIVGNGVAILIVTVVFMLGLILLQAKTTFSRIFSVVLWSNTAIGILSFIVLAASLMVKDEDTLRSLDVTKVASSVPTNPGVFLDSSTSPMLRSLLTSMDIFTIWLMALTIIGFTAISGKKKAKGGITEERQIDPASFLFIRTAKPQSGLNAPPSSPARCRKTARLNKRPQSL
jgi:uncharacterized protein YneF (UPF0154 family)